MTGYSDDDIDGRLGRAIRAFGNEAVDGFDPEATAKRAVGQRRTAQWRPIATVAGAVVVTSVALVIAGGGRNLPISLNAGASVAPATPDVSTAPPVGSTQSPTATLLPSAPASASTALTEAEAILVARAAAPQAADWPVLVAKSGTAQELLFDEGGYQVARDVPPDRLIWVVVLGESRGTYDAEGTIVVLDFVSGEVYESVDWLS